LISFGCVVGVILHLASCQESTQATIPENDDVKPNVFQPVKPATIPESVKFAGEPVPLNQWDVAERLDRELQVNTYWHSNTMQNFRLAERWFPLIEPILAEEGIPNDFKFLAMAESGLRDVVSPMQAAGFWQFLKTTGTEYGLEIDEDVDERYHVAKATRAACKYLKKAKAELGSWALAAASYNAGIQRLKQRIQEQQVGSYYDLYLTEETSRYVFRILALKILFEQPLQYGFYFPKTDLYRPFDARQVVVDSSIQDLPAFAKQMGTNYKTLKLMNPWMRAPYLKNITKKRYEILLPS